MAAHPDLDRFADLLIGSVPGLASEAAQRARGQLQGASLGNAAAADREHTMTVLALINPGPSGLVAGFSAALRQQLREQLTLSSQEVAAATMPGAADSLESLTLVHDEQIEEDIEIARVIQLVDTAAEADLRELNSLCATLRGATVVSSELHPMRPEVCARALSRALQGMQVVRGARMMALRVVGRCLADLLCELYREQLRTLRHWGVQPLPYQLQVSAAMRTDAQHDDAAMQRLAGRLAGEAGEVSGAGPSLAAQLIPKLLAQVAEQAGMDNTLQALMARLAGPAIHSAQAQNGVLSSFEHPLWRLVDRVAALGAVYAGRSVPSQRLARHLEPVVTRLEQAQALSMADYEQALADLEDEATDWATSQLADAGVAPEADAPTQEGSSLPTDWGDVGSLPTVPMELHPAAEGDAVRESQVWIAGLREGDLLRLFLRARWTTAQLAGRSSGHILLNTREGRALQSLSRRALRRLREQGLATTFQANHPVRHAVQTLTLNLDELV